MEGVTYIADHTKKEEESTRVSWELARVNILDGVDKMRRQSLLNQPNEFPLI